MTPLQVFLIFTTFAVLVLSQDTPAYFGTKTSYFVIANNDDSEISIGECQPLAFWYLARHGSRNPDTDDIVVMDDLLPKIRNEIVEANSLGAGGLTGTEIHNLQDWSLAVSVDDGGLMADSGRLEMTEMATRWKNRLAGMTIMANTTKARSSRWVRVEESGELFLNGILDSESEIPDIIVDDSFIRFYDDCPKWQQEVLHNEETESEVRKLESSDYFQMMIARVNIKTGVTTSMSDILLMWDICSFESAWYPEEYPSSPWCPIFTQNDRDLLNYRTDMIFYYYDSYAFDITISMTQPLIKDMLDTITNAANSKDVTNLVLNFGHSETHQPLVSALGLNRDDNDLLASDWPTSDYQWQTSHMAGFGANVGVLLVDCGADGHAVAMFQDETMVPQPACDNQMLCPLEQFTQAFSGIAEEDFDSVCST